MRSWICPTRSFAGTVMTAKVRIHLSLCGSRQLSQTLHGNGIGLFRSCSFHGPPLKEAFNGNDAAPFSASRAEGWQARQGFGPGVNRFASAARVLAPVRNQAPKQQIEGTFAVLVVLANDVQKLTWCDVV